MSRLGWDIERCRRFNWRPRFIIAPDCPWVGFAWLFWSGAVWLLPHTSDEAAVILAKCSGRTIAECRGAYEHWDHA